MSEPALRLGFIWPGGGAEHEYYQFAEAMGDRIKIFLSCTRTGGGHDDDHDVEHLLQTARIDWITEAANRLICLQPDCVFWACTSGSFIVGREGAEAQVSALKKTTGASAGSTSLAYAEVLRRLGLRSVSVLATYPEPATMAFVEFLKEFDIEVVKLDWLDAACGWDAALLEPDVVMQKTIDVAVDEAQAVLIPDTAMPSIFLAENLEKAVNRPVLTANVVTLWQAMSLAGRPMPIRGYGSLLENPAI